MGRIRIGALELGLNVEWRFAFVGQGERTQAVPDAVYLDVGGAIEPGILDQHHDGTQGRCTAALVRRFPAYVYDHLMLDWLRRSRDGESLRDRSWRPLLIAHRAPDFDAVVAMHLARQLIETGELPEYTDALCEYVSEVDQGSYKVDLARPETATEAIHLAYLAIQNLPAPPEEPCKDSWRVMRGEALLRCALRAVMEARAQENRGPLRSGNQLHPGQPGVSRWRAVPEYQDARQLLDDDIQRYHVDREAAEKPSVLLPSSRGADPIEVKAFLLSRPPESKLNKYWVRADGYPYFVCPYEKNPDGAEADSVGGLERYPKVILSLDPEWRDPCGAQPTLRGLGYALEEEEHQAREESGGDLRPAAPRYDDGSCKNGDPWYDGRGHDHTIVDAPGAGTHLSYRKICEIATRPFWEIPLVNAEIVVVRSVSDVGTSGWDMSAEVPAFEGMSPMLSPFIRDCRQAALPEDWSGFDPPPGFDLSKGSSSGARCFPDDTAGPVEFYSFVARPNEASLDGLLKWVRERRKESRSPLHVCAWIRLGVHFSAPERAQAMLEEVTGGGGEEIKRVEQGDEVLLFNSHSVVLHQSHLLQQAEEQEGAGDRLSAYRELMLYAVYVSEALRRFSNRIDKAIDKKGSVHGARHVRADFLHFQIRYFHYEVVKDQHQRKVFARVSDGLQLEKTYEEVQSELDRLDSAEQRRTSSTMEVLLFVLGLGVIVEAVGVIPTRARDWMIEGPANGFALQSKLVIGAALMLIAIIWFLWARRSRGSPPPDE